MPVTCLQPAWGHQYSGVISCSRNSQERKKFSLGTREQMHSFKLHLSPAKDRVAIDGTVSTPRHSWEWPWLLKARVTSGTSPRLYPVVGDTSSSAAPAHGCCWRNEGAARHCVGRGRLQTCHIHSPAPELVICIPATTCLLLSPV